MKKIIFLSLLLVFIIITPFSQEFIVGKSGFYKDGEIYRILSGSIHYSRIAEADWQDRLTKARAMGLNTISTSVFWNFHEIEEGVFNFTTGRRNLRKFIQIAGETGLNVILKPGPYISANWNMGGIPHWLLKKEGLHFRSNDKKFLKYSKNYLKHLVYAIDDLQFKNGGPIIMMQIENEYGSFGNDPNYLTNLKNIFDEVGIVSCLFTTDSADFQRIEAGSIEDVLPTISFTYDPEIMFQELDRYREDIPHFVGNLNIGTRTFWGDYRFKNKYLSKQLRNMKWMLENDKSFNLYMVHGGTNFGFSTGANHIGGEFLPIVTSYDYGAPISENGEITKKFKKIRKLLSEYQNIGEKVLPSIPKDKKKAKVRKIRFKNFSKVINSLDSVAQKSSMPLPMEYYGIDTGLIVYKTQLRGQKSGTLVIEAPHDRAYIYLNGKLITIVDRNDDRYSIDLPKTRVENPQLIIIVEALGRISFGPELMDKKGITRYITLNEVNVMNWEVYPIPFTDNFLANIQYNSDMVYDEPTFLASTFKVKTPGDIYLKMNKWSSGIIVINGNILGRYRDDGPQKNIFVPSSWLHKGLNTIYLLDMGMEHLPSISIIK